jgi:hypothetical protein
MWQTSEGSRTVRIQRAATKASAVACALGLAIVGTACFAAEAVAGSPKSAPRPASGEWKLQPLEASLKSGEFTLDGGTVKDVHGSAGHQPGCASGSFSVKGQFRIRQLTFAGKYRQWTVGSGHNKLGGLAALPIHLEVAGHNQVDATMTISFPAGSQLGAGEINWGVSQVSGISPCSLEYHVAR